MYADASGEDIFEAGWNFEALWNQRGVADLSGLSDELTSHHQVRGLDSS